MRQEGNSSAARADFEAAFAVLESRCFRDAKDLRRFKPLIWGRVMAMHKVTHLDIDECIQNVLHIVDQGCQNFYRTQSEELSKYCDPTNTQEKRASRARMSTFIFGHVTNKYNSFMTSFFAPIRTFEAGRVRTMDEEVHGIDTDGHLARALAEGRVDLRGGKEITVDENKVIRVRRPGTEPLARHNVDDPTCPVLEQKRHGMRPDLMAALGEFAETHRGAIDLIVALSESEPCPPGLKESFGSLARTYGLSLRDFMSAVRGIFGQDQRFQSI